jgi:hypothetical protein
MLLLAGSNSVLLWISKSCLGFFSRNEAFAREDLKLIYEWSLDALNAQVKDNKNATTTMQFCRLIGKLAPLKFESSMVYGALLDVLKFHGNSESGTSKDAVDMCCLAIESLCKTDPVNITKFNDLGACQIIESELATVDDLRRRACVRLLTRIDEVEKEGRTRSDEIVYILQEYKHRALVVDEV